MRFANRLFDMPEAPPEVSPWSVDGYSIDSQKLPQKAMFGCKEWQGLNGEGKGVVGGARHAGWSKKP
jgi:hypothetical protein